MKYLLFLLITFNLMAIDESQIQFETKKQISTVLEILQSSKSKEEKKQNILNTIDNIIDFDIMSKIVIGTQYFNSLTKEQQSEYSIIFTEKIKNSYYTKLENYTNESIEYKDVIKPKDTRIHMAVLIKNNGETVELVFKYYKNDKNDWRIYDIDILGVSITQSYRTQIQEILQKNKDFNNLISMLKKES